MKKLFFTFIGCCLFSIVAVAQQATISGQVTDGDTGEPLIGATISIGGGTGAVTDFDGLYSLTLSPGKHTLAFSYVSYKDKQIEIEVTGDETLDVKMETENLLNEVVITADIAIERETPVAFSNISTKKLEEELAAQDIPMVLNSTPGAYATQAGGGDGDARISIRGFDQRNVAVMLDGIPVNDMENGRVFWSNWFGLDLVTQTMQVQRGLGASKLSVPSIGGTINILTKGIDSKRGLKFKQEVGNNGFLRSTFGITSGRLANGFGVSAAGSYKQGDGWVDGNFTKGYFYYLRIDKQFGNHMISLSGFGAPQQHGQRSFSEEMGLYDTNHAASLFEGSDELYSSFVDHKQGRINNDEFQSILDANNISEQGLLDLNTNFIDTTGEENYGLRYNPHWGYKDGEVYNTRKNYYHKPQFSLRHSWSVNERLFWSNVAYLSIGTGGGTAPEGGFVRTADGILDIDASIEEGNRPGGFNPNGYSNVFIRSSHNDHFWYGVLSSLNFKITPELTFSGGVDARSYKGDHYRTVYDLLEGAGVQNQTENNSRIASNAVLQEGDRMTYDNSGLVRWGGVFGLLEYKKDKLSVFTNLSTAVTGYSMIDYMKPKIVELADTTLFLSFADTIAYGGQTYTLASREGKDQQTDWVNIPSFTFKTGAAYNINKEHSVFLNAGYISKAQRFNNVINSNRFGDELLIFNNYDNEIIKAVELGYSFKSPIFSANLNTYYTVWENKPLDFPPTVPLDDSDPESDRIPINVNGIDALHKGIELDFAFKPIKQLTIEGLASIGDWKWTSGDSALIQLPNGRTESFEFDATDVHVGDAAQLQFGGIIRYEPIKSLYFKLKGVHFAKNYASFQPEDLQGIDARRESWRMPNYTVFSFHTGYYFKVKDVGLSFRANILNLFDTIYISDARNNDDFNSSTSDFDAKSASVFFGQGRRFSLSLQMTL